MRARVNSFIVMLLILNMLTLRGIICYTLILAKIQRLLYQSLSYLFPLSLYLSLSTNVQDRNNMAIKCGKLLLFREYWNRREINQVTQEKHEKQSQHYLQYQSLNRCLLLLHTFHFSFPLAYSSILNISRIRTNEN